jgi:uncharacterized protein YciI
MKRFILLQGCFLMLCFSVFAQNKSSVKKAKPGMADQVRQYWFVMLTKGQSRMQDSIEGEKIQQGHLANITRLYYEGKIKVAGPFGDNGEWRGLFIFDCATKQEVDSLLKTDPAVSAGRLSYDIHPWWTVPIGSFTPGKPKNLNSDLLNLHRVR